jgi:hypothetical protein
MTAPTPAELAERVRKYLPDPGHEWDELRKQYGRHDRLEVHAALSDLAARLDAAEQQGIILKAGYDNYLAERNMWRAESQRAEAEVARLREAMRRAALQESDPGVAATSIQSEASGEGNEPGTGADPVG